jgi:hypothetical protein
MLREIIKELNVHIHMAEHGTSTLPTDDIDSLFTGIRKCRVDEIMGRCILYKRFNKDKAWNRLMEKIDRSS